MADNEWNDLVTYRGEIVSLKVSSNIPKDLIDIQKFKSEAIRKLRAESKREAEIVKRSLERVTRTWSDENKPTFTIAYGGGGARFYVEVSTDSAIFKWLNFGTKERYAVMTGNFKAKTTPRVIGSRAGRGGFSHLSRIPKEGIKAREWLDEIADRREPQYHKNMERVFQKVVRKYLAKGKSL